MYALSSEEEKKYIKKEEQEDIDFIFHILFL